MGINFPNAPTVGQLYPQPAVAGQPVYRWDGEKWVTGTADSSGVVRYDMAQALTANQKAQARANIDALKKNYIVNGAMMVSQENGSAAGTTSVYYPADQWYNSFSMAGTYTFQQVASLTPGGSQYRLRVTVTAPDASVGASDICVVGQKLEGFRIADLAFGTSAARTVTLRFGVKAPAGTYCVSLINGPANRNYIAEYTISAGESNVDTIKTITLVGDLTGSWPSNNALGMFLYWCLMAGTSVQMPPNVWSGTVGYGTSNQFNFMGTNGNVFELFDVGLHEGNAAPAFQVPDFASELIVCKRYWQKLGGTANADLFFAGYQVAGAQLGHPISYPVEMRAAPTATRMGTWGTLNVTSTQMFTGTRTMTHSMLATATGNLYMQTSDTSTYIKLDARL